jgi:hypothetical protein
VIMAIRIALRPDILDISYPFLAALVRCLSTAMPNRPMRIPARIDSAGKPGMPVPFGGVDVMADDCVAVTDVVLLIVTMLVVVDVNDETRKVVDVDTVETTVEVAVTPVTAEIAPAGANLKIVERALVADTGGVMKPGDEPTIQPVLGEVM